MTLRPALIVAAALGSLLPAQVLPPGRIALPWDAGSGPCSNPETAAAMAWSDVISLPEASSLQLHFGTAALGHPDDRIVVSSVQDGSVQVLDRAALKWWQNHTAWFNGQSVVVSLHLTPGSRGEVAVDLLVADSPAALPETLCGADDRGLTTNAAICRLVPSGTSSCSFPSVCAHTAFLVSESSGIVTAASNGITSSFTVAEFNVPASTSSGAIVHPMANSQYPVNAASVVQSVAASFDDNWAVARLLPNFGGVTAAFNQNAILTLATSIFPGGAVTVTGYGADDSPDLTRHHALQSGTGTLSSLTAANGIGHTADTLAGSEGSPLRTTSGLVVGVHTSGGCSPIFGGVNGATRVTHPGLQAAVASVAVCGPITLANDAPQVLPCSDTRLTVAPAAGRWNVVSVTSPGDWELRLGTSLVATVGNTAEFLAADGRAATGTTATSGRSFEYSGGGPASGEFQLANSFAIGAPATALWSNGEVLEAFEFQVVTAGSFDITVAGSTALRWELLRPDTDRVWDHPFTLDVGTVGAAPRTNVALSPGWHCIVVVKNGGVGQVTPATLTVSVCATAAPVALAANGSPTAVSGNCRPFTITPVASAWNVVGITSASDWSVAMGGALAASPGTVVNFLAANGGFSAVTPASGVFGSFAGSAAATAQHRSSTSMSLNSTLDTNLPSGSVFRAHHFNIAAAGAWDFTISGDPSLRYALLLPGTNAAWRNPTAAHLTGTVPSSTFLGLQLGTGVHCLIVSRPGGVAASALPYTVNVCAFAGSLTFASAGQSVGITNPCTSFSLFPVTGRWNAVGVTSTSDWDVTMGSAESQNGGSTCDYVIANGRLGAISPVFGLSARFSGSTGAQLQHAFTAAMPGPTSTLAAGWSASDVIRIVEFQVFPAVPLSLSVTGSNFLRWVLFAPGSSSSWRIPSSSFSGAAVGSGALVNQSLTPGWWAIAIVKDGGAGTTGNYTIQLTSQFAPAPAITSLSPSTVLAESGALTLTLNGTGLWGWSVVRWNGTALSTTYVSGTQLQAAVPASFVATAGLAAITVVTAAPGGGTSNAATFTVANPPPVLTSLSPAPVTAGGPAFVLFVAGSGFVDGSIVHWNGMPLPTGITGSTALEADVPASLITASGTAQISVVTPAPGGGTSSSLGLPIVPPVVLTVAPTGIAVLGAVSPPVTITLTGLGFHAGSVVVADGFALPTTFNGTAQLACTLWPSVPSTRRPGGIALTVQNSVAAVSNTRAVQVGGPHANLGTIRRQPLQPLPGEAYAAVIEGGRPLQPVSVYVDFANVPPVVNWPDAAADFVLSVGPYAGSPGPMVPLRDGVGIEGPSDGTNLDAGGGLVLPGFVLPSPALGIDLTVQAIYLDPTATYGFRLTWARFPDRL